jgi:5-methylthioribose kinase
VSRSNAHVGQTVALTTASVTEYLIQHGVTHDPVATVEALGGGVSADAYAVHAVDGSWVVKQALAQLKVAVEWHADPTRVLNEAAALVISGKLIPGSIPQVTMVDRERLILVMQHAPTHLHDWKSELMAGGDSRSADTAARLGEVLAVIHGGTLHDPVLASQFGDTGSFVELRIDPFHRTVARRLPELAGPLDALANELIEQPRCLVHGDYSPKNVLASGSEVWVIDWEVAHFGNPVFDLAFMLAHLLCKTVHIRSSRDLYQRCAHDFLAAYVSNATDPLRPDPVRLVRHTAAVVLARTDGKSPAAYLNPPERSSARQIALRLLETEEVNETIVQHLWGDFT